MTFFFQKIMMNFNLPVYYKELTVVMGGTSLMNSDLVRWIIYSITPTSSTLDHFKIMLDAINSYFHSTSEGRNGNGILPKLDIIYLRSSFIQNSKINNC